MSREVALSVPALSADQICEVLWNLVGSLRVRGFSLEASRAYLENFAACDFWEAVLSGKALPKDDASCLISCNLGSLVGWCAVEDVHEAVRCLVTSWDSLLAKADAALLLARQCARPSSREPS